MHIAELGRNYREILEKGKAFTAAKEYISFTAMMGSSISELEAGTEQMIIPQTLGSEADGQYARVIRAELDRIGADSLKLVVPAAERLLETADDFNAFCRAAASGDMIYAAPISMREHYAHQLAEKGIPTWEKLEQTAAEIGKISAQTDRILAVGTPMLLTSLQEGVLDRLETQEKVQILRMPILEYLWMLWMDQRSADNRETEESNTLDELKLRIQCLSEKLGDRSSYSTVPDSLIRTADEELKGFAGANGRYRYAKIMNPPDSCCAVLHVVPRYENTEMILEMRGTANKCPVPYYNLALDGDWDSTAESRLRSFLYYVR